MQFRSAGLDLTIRTILAAALAFGVTTLTVFESHAGPTPTPTPVMCAATWPETTIFTAAKGQSPTNNAKVSHAITGHIIDPGSLRDTAHRIEVCAGTQVTSTVTDTTGIPTNTAAGGLLCTPGACSGVVDVTEKYQSISQDGRDKDSITFIPK
jgi:hypothetical protein